jgi:hypothetical protein
MNGARFAGVTFPYEDLILIGVGVAVGATEAATVGAELAAGVPPPHAPAMNSAVIARARTRRMRIPHLPRLSVPRGGRSGQLLYHSAAPSGAVFGVRLGGASLGRATLEHRAQLRQPRTRCAEERAIEIGRLQAGRPVEDPSPVRLF